MKLLFLPLCCFLLIFSACNKKDIRALRDDLNEQKERIDQLEAAVSAINGDVKTLQTLTAALQKNIGIKSYTATSNGYLLTMSDGNKIELKNGTNGTNGKDGKDGVDAPKIGVKKDTDGQYYWTLAGAFIIQDGKKLRVTGNNGQDGEDGQDGTNGTNGITPQLKVDSRTNVWLISYDNGKTWNTVKDNSGNPVPATGEQGPQGEQGAAGIPGFSISETDASVIITYQGNNYVFPKGNDDNNANNYKMVFVTGKSIGDEISIVVDAAIDDRADIWIDLNNNKQRDGNENFAVFTTDFNRFTLSSTTVTIYGKVTYLGVAGNELTYLDVSKNPLLNDLFCPSNNLKELDVSKNLALSLLDCGNNEITSLDVSKCTALKSLSYSGNKITTLDLSKNTKLEYLYCNNSKLTTLDVSKNTALKTLYCNENQLTALDVSKNGALTNLRCTNNALTQLDVSKNTALQTLECTYNKLSSLDLSKNTELSGLICHNNQISNQAMTALIISLPDRSALGASYGEAQILSTDAGEGNTMPNTPALSVAKSKNWRLYKKDGASYTLLNP